MDELARRSRLYDFYGPLLTSKQCEVYDWYYLQDLSLGEIAQIQGVSRQAVYDLLKRTEEALKNYEEKLSLVTKYEEQCHLVQAIKHLLGRINLGFNSEELAQMTQLIKKLEDLW